MCVLGGQSLKSMMMPKCLEFASRKTFTNDVSDNGFKDWQKYQRGQKGKKKMLLTQLD